VKIRILRPYLLPEDLANISRAERERQAEHGGTDVKPVEQIRRGGSVQVRPNDICPCGSEKKYKKCHGRLGMPPLTPRQLQDWQMKQQRNKVNE